MKKRSILWWILISTMLMTVSAGTMVSAHPASAILDLYADDIPGRNTIEPYIISILALSEVTHERHLEEVKQFILWYFSKLNYPDHHGLTGTIYVYVLEGGQERSTNKYDSVDGYSGLFLHLLHQYVIKTGDVAIIQENWERIEDIAYLIPLLQDTDGLTLAIPGRNEKYLMDNCEALAGISAYLQLKSMVGKEEHPYYSQVQNSIRSAIREQFFTSKDILPWAVVGNEKSISSWRVFYPDSFAQLFPIYYGLLEEHPDVKKRLWRSFNRKYANKVSKFPIEQRIMYELTKRKVEGK